MMYLKFPTSRDAVKRSEDEWTAVLGRPKRAEDVTQYLWGTITDPQDGVTLVAIDPATQSRVKQGETAQPGTDPDIKAVLDSVKSPPPAK